MEDTFRKKTTKYKKRTKNKRTAKLKTNNNNNKRSKTQINTSVEESELHLEFSCQLL